MWKLKPDLQHPNTIAIGLFADGLSPFRSSKISYWIMYGFILNLPLEERYIYQNQNYISKKYIRCLIVMNENQI